MYIKIQLLILFLATAAGLEFLDELEGSGAETTTTTRAPTTTAKPGPCASNPCSLGSTCQELPEEEHKCLCGPGLYYDDNKGCSLARTFPTDLKLAQEYSDKMADKNSKEFQETAGAIIDKLKDVFKDDIGYLGSTVLSLRKGSVIADVQNFYDLTSDITAEYVKKSIDTAAAAAEDGSLLKGAAVTTKTVCNSGFCDTTSTNCTDVKGLGECTCKKGFVKSLATQQACSPCINSKPAENLEGCINCPTGFSGINCEDPYLLILIVVACVLGALFISTFIATIVLSTRKPKNSTKSSSNKAPNGDLDFHKQSGIPKIPRANANSGWQPANLEMAESGSTSALVTRDRTDNRGFQNGRYGDYDDMNGYRNQSPTRNGYGGMGGHNVSKPTRNPYYDPDDERMRRY